MRKTNANQQDKPEETTKIKKKITYKPVKSKKPVAQKKITTEKVIKQDKSPTVASTDSIEKTVPPSSATPAEPVKEISEATIPIKTEPVQASAPITLFNKADYNRIIRKIIAENREYPLIARRRGIQGTVLISFNILIDGSVTDFNIEKSSGFSQLDSAAHRILMKSAPFPPPPEKIDFTLPITFEIK